MNVTYTLSGRTFHLLFPDLLRPLSSEELADLQESILANGLQMPIVTDEEDGVIDGGHRLEVAWANDLEDIPVQVVTGLDLEGKRNLALGLNLARRHLTQEELQEQRQQRIGRVATARREGDSLRTIAEKEGVSLGQVQRDLQDGSGVSGDTPASDEKGARSGVSGDTPDGGSPKVTGRDGKTYPATRQPSVNGTHTKAPKTAEPTTPDADPEEPPSREPGDDTDTEDPELPTEAPEIPTDEEGTPLPAQAVLAFDGLPTLRKHLKALDTFRKELEAAKSEPWARWVHWPGILGSLKSARSSLFQGRPACVCPYCKGLQPDCRACQGHGFVSRVAYENAPPEMKNGEGKS